MDTVTLVDGEFILNNITNISLSPYLQHFEADTEDLAGVEWSPDGRVLGIWESCLNVSYIVMLPITYHIHCMNLHTK